MNSSPLQTRRLRQAVWMEYDFQKNGTVLEEQLQLDVPKDRVIKLKTKPGNDPKITEANGRRLYGWSSSHVDKDEDEKKKDKLKKPKKEPDAPAVQMTTFSSWEEMGRWYAGLEKERREPTPEIRAKATALTQGKASDLDKIQSLYDYVATNSAISACHSGWRFQPHPAGDVLHNQYGDCKDKNTLLASLLKASGYDASSVLINSGRNLIQTSPRLAI
jgi:transglutaminase-like putative cysteine protease